MTYNILIERLRHPANTFLFDSQVAKEGWSLLTEAAAALATLQAENDGLRKALEGIAKYPRLRRDELSAETMRHIANAALLGKA